jgi:hypothetical protein
MIDFIILSIFCIPIGFVCALVVIFTHGKEYMSPGMKTFKAIANVMLPVCLFIIAMWALGLYYWETIDSILY